jgi:diguanylate cyclase (GGDEF)-like protein
VSIEIGGSGANLAINLAKLDHQTKFLTAMNSSPYSIFVLEYLRSLSVTPIVEWNESLPLAAFCAQLDKNGELESAISSMPVAEIRFSKNSINKITESCDAIILECNLAVSDINRIIRRAKALKIPIYLSAVSEEKVEKIRFIDKENMPDVVFMNKLEYKQLKKTMGMCGAPIPIVAEKLSCDMVVSNGNSDIEIGYRNGESDFVSVTDIAVTGNALGAGDILMSSAIHLITTKKVPLKDAISMSIAQVKEMLKKKNCNLGEQSALENALGRLHQKADRDALTGLYNRGSATLLATRMLNEATANKRDISAIIIDIDHFKLINDTYGHDVGDEVIIRTAQYIHNAVREHDIAARWGGEEFVCMLPDNNAEIALKVAERIRQSIQSGFSSSHQITVSIGVASLCSNMNKFEELIKAADQALYSAKNAGRNTVICA